MGLDPGLRTGVKIAVVDGTGKVLDTTTVYPHEPRKDWDGTLRTLAVLYSSYTHLVTLDDSGITDVAQLKGRTVSMGAAGSGTATLGFRILEAAGVDTKKDVRPQSLGVAQSVDALKDGKIDAFFWNGGLPTASVLDLVNTPRIRARFIATDLTLPQLEKKDYLKRRIDAAAKFVPLENLCLSPQCGFSSTHHGNKLSVDDEKRKLELVVSLASEVWRSA